MYIHIYTYIYVHTCMYTSTHVPIHTHIQADAGQVIVPPKCGWRRPVGSLIFAGHVLQKSPRISGSFCGKRPATQPGTSYHAQADAGKPSCHPYADGHARAASMNTVSPNIFSGSFDSIQACCHSIYLYMVSPTILSGSFDEVQASFHNTYPYMVSPTFLSGSFDEMQASFHSIYLYMVSPTILSGSYDEMQGFLDSMYPYIN